MGRRLVELCVCGTTLIALETAGVAFQPIQPATCPAITEVNWNYNISDQGTGEWMSEPNQNATDNYANNLDYWIGLTANEFVNEFWVRFGPFSTEPTNDYLEVASWQPGGGTFWQFSGDVLPWQGQPVWTAMQSTVSFPAANGVLRFHSDANNTSTGVVLDRAGVCTYNPGAAVQNIAKPGSAMTRYSGVLLGDDDVAYFYFPVGSQADPNRCDHVHDTFALQGDPSPGNDFDLYARCGALPTDTEYDFVDYSGQTFPTGSSQLVNTGFIHTTTASCPCGSYWYIAVHSYTGRGWFNLVNHKHYDSQHRSSLSVGIQNWVSNTDFYNIMAEVEGGFRHFFGANEGIRYIDQFSLDEGVFGGDIQVNVGSGRPHSDCSTAWYCGAFGCFVSLYTIDTGFGYYDHQTLSHELGHFINCLGDEYEDNVGDECGHSIMGQSRSKNNNYCWILSSAGDHGRDPAPPTTPASSYYNSIWPQLGDQPYWPTSTPDNYDFQTFDFHGQYAVPVYTAP